MTPLLVTADGAPFPPSDVVRAVRRVDPTLDLKWVGHMGTWAIIAPWRDSDPRRGLVQSGALAPDASYDIVCHLPADCPVDAAEGYLRRGMVSSNRADIVKMLDRLEAFNEQQSDVNADKAIEPILDDLDSAAARRLTNTPASFLNDATQPKKKGKR